MGPPHSASPEPAPSIPPGALYATYGRKEDADPISIDLSTQEIPVLSAAELTKLATGDMTPAVTGMPVKPRVPREAAEGASNSKNKIDPLLVTLVESGG